MGVRDRGVARGLKGKRRYPILWKKKADLTEDEEQERIDATYLNDRRTKKPKYTGNAKELWDEIMMWRHPDAINDSFASQHILVTKQGWFPSLKRFLSSTSKLPSKGF